MSAFVLWTMHNSDARARARAVGHPPRAAADRRARRGGGWPRVPCPSSILRAAPTREREDKEDVLKDEQAPCASRILGAAPPWNVRTAKPGPRDGQGRPAHRASVRLGPQGRRAAQPKDAARPKGTLWGWPAKVARDGPKGQGCKGDLGKHAHPYSAG